jgi:hypothetical protein
MLLSASIPSETLQPSLALVRRYSSIFAYVCERGFRREGQRGNGRKRGGCLRDGACETTHAETTQN